MGEAEGENRRGTFFVVDGIDGCGKTSQAVLLCESLGAGAALHLREPGSTALGEGLRALLLDRQQRIEPAVEVLMFAAARRQMLEELVAPALARGEHVVCERFHPSTYAYQAVAGDLDGDQVLELLRTWAGAPRPDLVLLLEVDVAEAARRRGAATDRIEAKGLEYQRCVAQGYRRYAELDPAAVLVDGSGSAADVHARILEEVERVRR